MSSQLIAPPPTSRPSSAPSQRRPVPKANSARKGDPWDEWYHPDYLKWKNVDWVTLVFLAGVHAGALAAPFFFSWAAAITAGVLYWATASIGICLGYHRYLSHRSFKLTKPAEFCVLSVSAIAGEGSPLAWSATHRLHHQKSDHTGDPHSPFNGNWWSHILWLFVNRTPEQCETVFRKYAPELYDRPMVMFFERTYGRWLLATGLTLLGIGYAVGGVFGAISFLTWTYCLRMVVAYHSTWFVNSATHLWGYRNYETRDQSRNLWWVAILAFGEGWHNNHHAHPSIAPSGHRWWEFDATWCVIKLLRFCGLAYDVKTGIPERQEG
jgi:fatty-acid desaturase